MSTAPFICNNTVSLNATKSLFQYKSSFPLIVKSTWMGLNVFQYPSKILLVGPKGLQELEFNPQQRLLFRCTENEEKHLFLLSGPIKRSIIMVENTFYLSAQTS
tara:strand:- start:1319 stop:1630 length:312 start_codon:yes stop_codon:yes gene_type:complete